VSEQRTVGTAILEMLAAQGVDTVFGLPGVHNLAFWSSETPVRIVGVRHEQACVYAADGYARATGRLGVALTTTGPGAINALAAFGEAAVSGAPVLLISSDVSTALRSPEGPRGILHEMGDQAAPFATLDRPARTVTSADEALTAVAESISLAMSPPRGPAYVGIPSDILNAPWDGPLPSAPASCSVSPVGSQIDVLADLIAESPRVVIWSGGGVAQTGDAGHAAVQSLAERLGDEVREDVDLGADR
jgi:acetolactate synthase-1/2/3 large subunit